MEVVVNYKRVDDVFEGTVQVTEDAKEVASFSFEKEPYHKMCVFISRILRDIQRKDVAVHYVRANFLFTLPSDLVQLLTEDPVRYVHETSSISFHEVPVENKASRKAAIPSSNLIPFRTGRDFLADVFGDVIYVKKMLEKIECPLCGAWGNCSLYFNCLRCSACIPLVDVSNHWAGFNTKDLLEQKTKRFFLPNKEWNSYKNWVSKKDLLSRYEQFIKEKKNV